MKSTDKTRREEILREDYGGTNPGAGFYAGQQSEKPKKHINLWLVFFIWFIGYIIGLVVGAVIN